MFALHWASVNTISNHFKYFLPLPSYVDDYSHFRRGKAGLNKKIFQITVQKYETKSKCSTQELSWQKKPGLFENQIKSDQIGSTDS